MGPERAIDHRAARRLVRRALAAAMPEDVQDALSPLLGAHAVRTRWHPRRAQARVRRYLAATPDLLNGNIRSAAPRILRPAFWPSDMIEPQPAARVCPPRIAV